MKIPQVIRRNDRGRAFEQRARCRRLRKGDYVTQRRRAREQHGNAIEAYSVDGYDYAVEKAGSTKGWSFPIYEEAWNYGFHGEMAHFVECVRNDTQPLVTGDDARAVMEALFAAYQSAGTGRKVTLPFSTQAAKPIELWWHPEP